MSTKTTRDLIDGLETMLKNRGSMTVADEDLLKKVVILLNEHEKLEKKDKVQNGYLIVSLLLKFLTDPAITHVISNLIDKLL